MPKQEVAIFWFRRDLRLIDNTALYHALTSGLPVLPIFIFDEVILDELPTNDGRVQFIYENLDKINKQLNEFESSLLIKKGHVLAIWEGLKKTYNIKKVFFNKDYEPYAIQRDHEIKSRLEETGAAVTVFKDDVIFEENEVLKDDGLPYTIFTPYKNKWLKTFEATTFESITYTKDILKYCLKIKVDFPALESIGFTESNHKVRPYVLDAMDSYEDHRNFPALDNTSYLSPHLRFGTVSIRRLVIMAMNRNATFLSELIWREFFKVILFHFPKVVTHNFKAPYDGVIWRESTADFEKWSEGNTGYPIVDAGMRQLNATGYMHNRVRMVTASFLCKHLLLDWRLGEAYFAEKLLDYELSSNNGNWQWAAGTGCDASPYFRVFNPESQQKKFDKNFEYIKKWIPEFETNYCQPIIDHKYARERAIATYKAGILR
jgi:deoxyribodipyrimidine photo-lyase